MTVNDKIKSLLTPQCAQIFNHMLERGSISGVEAAAIYRVRALPRRIKDIKSVPAFEAQYVIQPERRTDPTGQRYVRYHLAKRVGGQQ